ncbi:MAG: hypothetical protein AVDCRST_MAG12-207, partial [uncultured Rubrobacteraceae bacterium]
GYRVGRNHRRLHQRGRPLRPLPAQEARPRGRTLASENRARRRLHLRTQTRVVRTRAGGL